MNTVCTKTTTALWRLKTERIGCLKGEKTAKRTLMSGRACMGAKFS
ncbi:MAG: hypothetical protein IJV56_05160 [Neisseriaceae bacterium]|nr:hypothetical protein [Neisseriaceae bacterium]